MVVVGGRRMFEQWPPVKVELILLWTVAVYQEVHLLQSIDAVQDYECMSALDSV